MFTASSHTWWYAHAFSKVMLDETLHFPSSELMPDRCEVPWLYRVLASPVRRRCCLLAEATVLMLLHYVAWRVMDA